MLSAIGSDAFGQNGSNDYAAHWNKVKAYNDKGLTTSALQEVNVIYQLAKKDNNQPQVIKALLFKNKLLTNVEENVLVKMIDTIAIEIKSSKQPARSVLQSIQAQMYENYLSRNRYKLYSRTNTEGFKKEDIETWTIDDLNDKIASLYEQSISESGILKKVQISAFDDILEKGNTRNLRPTLYDLLAHRALDYFQSSENSVNKPAYTFQIEDEKAFAPAKEFIKINFTSEDSASHELKALRLFQDLMKFHLSDPDPLIDVDLERLAFVKEKSVSPGKSQLYKNAVSHIFHGYNTPLAAMAGYLSANELYDEALSSKTEDSASLVTVAELLRDIIKKFPKSNGAISAQNLLATILSPSLQLLTENVNVPEIPFRTLIKFKNVENVYFKIFRVTKQEKENINDLYPPEKRFTKITALKSFRSWSQPLPVLKDYLEHSVEAKVDALPVGEYVLVASAKQDFSLGQNVMSAVFFYVSNISFVKSNSDYFVLDRTTGAPLDNAKIKIYKREYNYKSRKDRDVFLKMIKSDDHGYFKIDTSITNSSNYLTFDITHGNDRLFMDNYQYAYTYSSYDPKNVYTDQQEYDKENARIFFFTDRKIYRPGQIVYFKGIGITTDLKSLKPKLLATGQKDRIYLFNANGEKIDSVELKFNDYGSFNGRFTLPEGQMNGHFRLGADIFNGGTSFSVEEYKRPKFFAEFDTLKNSYRVNDTVRIEGKALAYAGNTIDGAKVIYRVRRQARFLYPWYFWRKGLPNVQPLEIVHGETVTDADGNFNISFAAIPDKTIDPKTDPVFDYYVSADITDINGETRSAEIIVPVGYKSLNIQIALPDNEVMNTDSLNKINVTVQNLSGEAQNAVVGINLYKLQTPDRLLRERLWQQPDTTIMSENEFISYFPHDVYKDEDKPQSWEKISSIFKQQDSVNGSGSFTLPKRLNEGWYSVEINSVDRYGQPVKDVKYFAVFDPKQKEFTLNNYLMVAMKNRTFEPSDSAIMFIGSHVPIHLIQQTETNEYKSIEMPSFNYLKLDNELKKFAIPITEKDRGGFGILNFFVKDNRFYFQRSTVNVPWNNKNLDISFSTYRDKTLPGSKENWTVKITGNKGRKVAAEMLASMYDASLDQFVMHSWPSLNVWNNYTSKYTWTAGDNFSSNTSFNLLPTIKTIPINEKSYDRILFMPSGFPEYIILRGLSSIKNDNIRKKEDLLEVVVTAYGSRSMEDKELGLLDSTVMAPVPDEEVVKEEMTSPNQPLRKNFNETVFFYPELLTDKEGNITFNFTMPEALTTWKLMAMAHTKDLASGYTQKEVITQKDLMIVPNAPRFMREGDQMQFSAKVVNMTDHSISGKVKFHLLNASTLNPVDEWFANNTPEATFSVEGKQSTSVVFSIHVPKDFNDAVVYRIVAEADNMSDGEEAFIPVVTNRMMVTESLPLYMRGNGSKTFNFQKLLQSAGSKSLSNYGLTVEYTPNPAWYAVQSLPYLNDYPYECTEQVFNRYFANALAMHISNSTPKLTGIFEKWKTGDTAALLSNLQKNEELKSVLLEETPWVLQAKSEEQQKKNIALLFDLSKMSAQLKSALNTVKTRQSSNGGFVWFKGGPDDRYMSQYILADIGHLYRLGAWPEGDKEDLKNMIQSGFKYLDNRIDEDYTNLKKIKNVKLDEDHLSSIAAHYLYTRSFFPDIKISSAAGVAYQYYLSQAKKYWLRQSAYTKGMIALALYRNGEKSVANDIVRSLKENAINNEELGMYWKEWTRGGYWWYQAPIESQSLMIEVFSEITNDQKVVGDLKTWLLKNKQTNHWESTKATAEACYALLLQGADWLSADNNVQIKLGNITTFDNKNEKQEAGTGYFKRSIPGSQVEPEMGKITINVSENKKVSDASMPSWGAVYWQYFEDLDKITFAETPLKLSKKLFVQTNTDRGPVLSPVNDGDKLNVGDKIVVRIELRSDRDMEYVHMKDMRASCMEPVNVLSGYKWQGGLGYYETTKDVSTNFFFNYLPKGTYVFEYPMFVTHSGDYSNGITTIQCMYAPEFTAHSEGVRVKVE